MYQKLVQSAIAIQKYDFGASDDLEQPTTVVSYMDQSFPILDLA